MSSREDACVIHTLSRGVQGSIKHYIDEIKHIYIRVVESWRQRRRIIGRENRSGRDKRSGRLGGGQRLWADVLAHPRLGIFSAFRWQGS